MHKTKNIVARFVELPGDQRVSLGWASRANGGTFHFVQGPYSQFAAAPGKCNWHGFLGTWLSRAGEIMPVPENPGFGRGFSLPG